MVSCPLLTPLTFLLALTHRRCAAKRGLRGLGSVRRADFETLSDPEFPLRDLPRITVRGQTVQGGGETLRKAPLRSMVYPWSTRRPCGPLAFRRATEGSRVQRKGWGVKRGRETLVSLPLLPPRRRAAAMHTPCHGEYSPSREGLSRLQRRTAVSAENFASADGIAEKGAHRLRRQAAGTAEPLTLC